MTKKEEALPMAPVKGQKPEEEHPEWKHEVTLGEESKPKVRMPESKVEEQKIELRKMEQGPILKNPRMLYLIAYKMEKNGYIGELENKLNIFLVGTTKDYKRRHRMGIVIGGESGVGKSWLLKIFETYFPEDVVSISRMTAHAPDYMEGMFSGGTCDGKILLIKQIEGAEDSGPAIMIMLDPVSGGLRLLTVEDKKIKERVLKGMPVIGTSSVRVSFDPQIIRRFLDIHPDDSPEQTARIMEHDAKLEEDPEYEKNCETVDSDIKEIVGTMKLESSKFGVENPFASFIPPKIPKVILARTDILKVFGMIVAVTHLFYQDRFHFTNKFGTETLIASPADYYLAWRIVGKTITKRLSGISDDRITILIKALEKIDPKKEGVSAEDIHKAVPQYQMSTIYEGMGELRNQGYSTTEKNPKDERKRVYKRTGKALTPIDIVFPDKQIEETYIKFVKEHFGKLDEESGKKHALSAEETDLLRKSLIVCDIATGRNITKEVISEETFKEYNLGDVSV